MDPDSLHVAEFLGRVGIAGLVSVSLTGDANPKKEGDRAHAPVSTTVLCPGWRCNADVIIGLKEGGADNHLGILACDLLLEGERCDEGCITPVVRT